MTRKTINSYVPPSELVLQYQTEIWNREKEIDRHSEEDWSSMTLGWAIAKGLAPKEAKKFKLYVTYYWDQKDGR
jgi:hypothetical protein